MKGLPIKHKDGTGEGVHISKDIGTSGHHHGKEIVHNGVKMYPHYHLQDRAKTNEQKREIIERLYNLWVSGDVHWLRLGQLFANLHKDIFYIEDYKLIQELEDLYTKSDLISKQGD